MKIISGEDGTCTEYLSKHKAGEWIRIRAHQSRTELDLLELKVYVNDVLQKVITNTIAVKMHDVKVIAIVVPHTPNSGRIRNAWFGEFRFNIQC